jgi:hypothetical protein
MNITTTTRPYALNASKEARFEALHELTRLQPITDLNTQDDGCRTTIQIGETLTYWSKGLSPATPPFVQHTVNGVKRLHVIDQESLTVAVYDRTAPKTWERRAVLETSVGILASLPKKALQAPPASQPATPKQIATVQKLLELPGDRLMPTLSVQAASRILDRILSETSAVELFGDLKRLLAERHAVAA